MSINPCLGCNPAFQEFITRHETEMGNKKTDADNSASGIWDKVVDFRTRSNILSAQLDPQQLARNEQEQSALESLAVKAITMFQEQSVAIELGLNYANTVDCGDATAECPKSKALLELYAHLEEITMSSDLNGI